MQTKKICKLGQLKLKTMLLQIKEFLIKMENNIENKAIVDNGRIKILQQTEIRI